METTPDVFADLNGNEIAIDADAQEAIFQGKDFLTRVNLVPPYGTQSIRFEVVEQPKQSGRYEIRDSNQGGEILGNLGHDAAIAVLNRLSAAMGSEDSDVFSRRTKASSLDGAWAFLLVGVGIAIVAFPVAGMARMGWELAARVFAR
jgi:hypothetical protein